MTNSIALVLGVMLVAAIVADTLIYGTNHVLFVAKKLTDLLEWLAFWR